MAKKNIWKYVAIGACAVLLVGGIVGISSALKKDAEETTRTLNASDYARYVLDDTTGVANLEDQSNISTNAFYRIDDFKCELGEEATVSYQLNFYSEDKQFIKMETRTQDFDGSEIESLKSQGVAYVRVEIIPKGDADGVVGIFEKDGYVKQLTVTVSKEDSTKVEDEESEASDEVSEATDE